MPSNRSERVGPAIDAVISMLKSKPKAVRAGQEGFTIVDLMNDRKTRKNLFHIRYVMRFLLELGFIRYTGFVTRYNHKVYRFNKGSFAALRRRRAKVK